MEIFRYIMLTLMFGLVAINILVGTAGVAEKMTKNITCPKRWSDFNNTIAPTYSMMCEITETLQKKKVLSTNIN